MNNLEQINRLSASYPSSIALFQPSRFQGRLQSDERQTVPGQIGSPFVSGQGFFALSEKRFQAVSIPFYFHLPDGGLNRRHFGSREFDEEHFPDRSGSPYFKNGILVHRAGKTITSKDVEDALNDE